MLTPTRSAGKQIGSELHALPCAVHRCRQCLGEAGLADARHVFDQQVAFGEQTRHGELDGVLLALDDSSDVARDGIEERCEGTGWGSLDRRHGGKGRRRTARLQWREATVWPRDSLLPRRRRRWHQAGRRCRRRFRTDPRARSAADAASRRVADVVPTDPPGARRGTDRSGRMRRRMRWSDRSVDPHRLAAVHPDLEAVPAGQRRCRSSCSCRFRSTPMPGHWRSPRRGAAVRSASATSSAS